MIKAAIYARVSSPDQAEEEIPIAGQLEECRKYAASHNLEIVTIFKDEGKTGKNENRDGFKEMMREVAHKPARFQKIIVWRGNRIARNTYNRLGFQSVLAREGVDLISLNEPEFQGSTKVLMVPIMAAIDEYQSYVIAEDTLRGMKMLAAQGYSVGGHPPKGYRVTREVTGIRKDGEPLFRVRWEPDPQWKDKALKAFQMLADGASTSDIIKETGVVHNKSSLSTYFRNRCFIGERVFNTQRRINARRVRVSPDDPEIIRVPNAHPAIVPLALFNKVAQILEKRRPVRGMPRNTKHDYILSDVLWCKECEKPMMAYGNKKSRYYACEGRRHGTKKDCSCLMLKKDAFESFIIDVLQEKVFTKERINQALLDLQQILNHEEKGYQADRARLKQKIGKLELEITNLENAIASGKAIESLTAAIEKREIEKKTLEKDLADLAIERMDPTNHAFKVTSKLVSEIREEITHELATDDPDKRRRFIRAYIKRITVEGANAEIEFTLADSAKCLEVMVPGVGIEPT